MELMKFLNNISDYIGAEILTDDGLSMIIDDTIESEAGDLLGVCVLVYDLVYDPDGAECYDVMDPVDFAKAAATATNIIFSITQ